MRRAVTVAVLVVLLAGVDARLPADAATGGVSTSFPVVATTGTWTGDGMHGYYFEVWDVTTVAVGTAPALATVSFSLVFDRYCNYGYGAQVSLDDHLGDTLFAGSGCGAPANYFGMTVFNATGTWASLVGHSGVLEFTVGPTFAVTRTGGPPNIGGFPECSAPPTPCQVLDPFVGVASLTIS